MEKWKPFNEIDFSDKTIQKVSIDTRDFHCAISRDNYHIEDIRWKKETNKSNFIHSKEELDFLIKRLFEESGGNSKKWRMLSLDSNSPDTKNWAMKYIRIFRVDEGFVVCNSYNIAISKNNLSAKVNQELLGAY